MLPSKPRLNKEANWLVPMDPKLLDAPKKAMLSGLISLYKGLSEIDTGISWLEDVLNGVCGICS